MKNFPSAESLLSWFNSERRAFPWREGKRDFYRVWISEIMLQQTRAEVVIPYYKKWMKKYPALEDLAHADEKEVIKMWEGLGYYSRARNLLLSAKQIVKEYDGKPPETREKLLQLKGMGRYSSAAVLAFAYKKPFLAVDGNVARVLARYFASDDDISSQKTKDNLEQRGFEAFAHKDFFLVAEGLIELGALVCKKNPECHLCPLKKGCIGYRKKIQNELPKKKKPPKCIKGERVVFVFVHQNAIFIQKNEKGRVMADLYEFPYVEWTEKTITSEAVEKEAKKLCSSDIEKIEPIKSIEQTFTRYHYTLFPMVIYIGKEAGSNMHNNKGILIPITEVQKLPFSSAHRKLIGLIKKKGIIG